MTNVILDSAIVKIDEYLKEHPRDKLVKTLCIKGYLNILKSFWPATQDKKTCRVLIIQHGHLHIVKWLCIQASITKLTTLANSAVIHGQIAILRYLYGLNAGIDVTHFGAIAATNGHLNILSWCYKQHIITKTHFPEISNIAIDNGNISLLNWLKDHGYLWTMDNWERIINAENKALMEWATIEWH